MALHSVFNSAVPPQPGWTTYADSADSQWVIVGNLFYLTGSLSGWKVNAVQLYLHSGSNLIGIQVDYGALVLTGGITQLETTPGATLGNIILTGSPSRSGTLVAGWNTLTLPAPLTIPPNTGIVAAYRGVTSPNDRKYEYIIPGNAGTPIQASDGSPLYLSESGTASIVRGLYRYSDTAEGGSNNAHFGLDLILDDGAGGGSNAGTFSATLPKVTAAITGASKNNGTLGASVPRVRTTISGTAKNNGTLAAATPKITSSIAGNSVNPGTLAASLPVVTANIGESAAAIPGTFSATLPLVTTSITGAMENDGVLAASTPAIIASLTGQSVNPGSFNVTLPKVTAAIADTSSNPGTFAAALPKITTSISGQSVNPGTFAAALPKVTSSIAGTSRLSGSLNASLPLATFAASGSSKVIGSLNGQLPKVTFAGTGTVGVGAGPAVYYLGDVQVQLRLGDLPVLLKKG